MKKRSKVARKPNYVDKVVKLWEHDERPEGIFHIDVAHDEWCKIYDGGVCNCDPDVTARPPEQEAQK